MFKYRRDWVFHDGSFSFLFLSFSIFFFVFFVLLSLLLLLFYMLHCIFMIWRVFQGTAIKHLPSTFAIFFFFLLIRLEVNERFFSLFFFYIFRVFLWNIICLSFCAFSSLFLYFVSLLLLVTHVSWALFFYIPEVRNHFICACVCVCLSFCVILRLCV